MKVQRQLQKLEVMNQERELQALEFEAEATGLWSLFHFLAEHEFRVTTEETPVKTPVETLVETPVKTQVEKKTQEQTPDLILEILASNSEMTLAEVAEMIGKWPEKGRSLGGE